MNKLILIIIVIITALNTGCTKQPYSDYPDNVTCQRIQQQLTLEQQNSVGIDKIPLTTQSRLLNEYRKAGCSPFN